MLFHQYGYVSEDPRVKPIIGNTQPWSAEIPDEIDVLIVGAGPAGMMLAAQLSVFPSISTRLIERRPGRLVLGHADGIQSRAVETFMAFDFAERIVAEAYQITQMNFWAPNPTKPEHIVRTDYKIDDEAGLSEFPHIICNQARVLDYFAEFAANSPSRFQPDWGWELESMELIDGDEYPVKATLRGTGPDNKGVVREISTKYLVGADGAKSLVRRSIGRRLVGKQANHAWGVMDALYNTDFPDIRTKCAIHSSSGSILLIPREGGFLDRFYVDLGTVSEDDGGKVRATSLEEIVERANAIVAPYTLDIRHVAWHSVYEVGHRVTDKFDEVADGSDATPHIFIAGDACHTHSAKAGQGMNVSMQDTFNLGWKLGYVLTGLSPESLLHTYSAERQVIAQDLIDFDQEWSTLMAKDPAEFDSPEALGTWYQETFEFPMGYRTQYPESTLVLDQANQNLATGYPVGKRFRSAPVMRVCDANTVEIGHQHKADGRWRIYAFADRNGIEGDSPTSRFAEWLASSPDSPVVKYTPAGGDADSLFDAKVTYQQGYMDFEVTDVPRIFRPLVGPYQVADTNKIYAAGPNVDIFAERGIARDEGVVIVVRPDMYVAAVLPMRSTDELTGFFDRFMIPTAQRAVSA